MPPCAPALVAIRCVYTDLDGTLLGQGASLFRTAEGDFTLLAARALEACHRAGAEVVIKSGRRRAQVMEDARLIGQTSYIFEVGSGHLHRRRGDVPDRGPPAARGPTDPRARSSRPARRRCCSTATRGGSSSTRPGTSTARSRTCSGAWSTCARRTRCSRPRATAQLRLVDNGEIEPRHAHLPPDPGRDARRRAPWQRTCAPAATSASSASGWATRARTWTSPRSSGRFFLVANAQVGDAAAPRGRRAHRGGHDGGLLRGRGQGAR